MKSQLISTLVRKHIIHLILRKTSSSLLKFGKALDLSLISSKSSSIKLLNENGNLVSDPKIISNVFNKYFSTIGPEIQRKIPFVPGSFKDYFNSKDENGKLLINPSNASFFLSHTVPGEIGKQIDALDVKKIYWA